MSAMVVVTTVGTEEQANVIARALVDRRQAACVNIVPRVRSVYRWQGEVCEDGELLLIIKTQSSQLGAIEATLEALHAYDVPEILAFAVDHGERRFLSWIEESVGGAAAGSGAVDDEGANDEEE